MSSDAVEEIKVSSFFAYLTSTKIGGSKTLKKGTIMDENSMDDILSDENRDVITKKLV